MQFYIIVVEFNILLQSVSFQKAFYPMAVLIIVVVSIILAVALVVAFILLLRRRRMKATTSAVDNGISDWPRQSAPPYVGSGAWNQQGAAGQTPVEWGQPGPPQQSGGWGTADAGDQPAQQQQSVSWGAQNPMHPADLRGMPAGQSQPPAVNPWENRGTSPPEPALQNPWKERPADHTGTPVAPPSLPTPAPPGSPGQGGAPMMSAVPPSAAQSYRVGSGPLSP